MREGGLDMGGTGYILVKYLYGEGGWIKGGLIEGGGCQRMGGGVGYWIGGFYIWREGGGAGFADLIQNPTFEGVGDS